jgi:hypothetical protein
MMPDRRQIAIVAVLTIETAEAEAVQAVRNVTTITATCSRRLLISHADTDASWSATATVYTRSMAPRAAH